MKLFTRSNREKSSQAGSRQLGIFYILSMLASFFNFLYYPVMARTATTSAYGEIQFLIVIIFQISLLFMALNVITVILSALTKNKQLLQQRMRALSAAFNLSTLLLACLASVFLYLSNATFHFSSPLTFIMLILAIFSTVPFTIGVGKLQGELRFIDAGVVGVMGPLLKLGLSYILVQIGLGAPGALLGIALGQIGAVWLASLAKWVRITHLTSLDVRHIKVLSSQKVLIITVAMCTIMVNGISAFDTVFAKALLSPEAAGVYAGTSTMAKIALFLVSPLTWMAIPIAINHSGQSIKKVHRLLYLSLAICLTLILGYYWVGGLLIPALLGARYSQNINLLPLATTAMSVLALSAMMNVILAARQRLMAVVIQAILIIAVFIAVLIGTGAHNIQSVLVAQLLSGTAGMIYYTVIALKRREW